MARRQNERPRPALTRDLDSVTRPPSCTRRHYESFSERDIVRGLTQHGTKLLAMPASELMTSPAVTCTPGESIRAVMARMTRYRVRHLPVVEGGKLCGIVSIGDLVKHRLDELELETNVLRENLMTGH